MDLGAVKLELSLREQKIKDLQADKIKLKTLLKKAKVALDSIGLKFKQAQDVLKDTDGKLREVQERNKDLMKTLEIF